MPPHPVLIGVEVVYAEPQRAIVKTFRVSAPATIADVLSLARADCAFDGIDLVHATVGVFGKVTGAGQILNDGDRVEIYRPLAADPKNARRARARQARNNRPR